MKNWQTLVADLKATNKGMATEIAKNERTIAFLEREYGVPTTAKAKNAVIKRAVGEGRLGKTKKAKAASNLTNDDIVGALQQVGPQTLDNLIETLKGADILLGSVPKRLVAVKAAALVKKNLLRKVGEQFVAVDNSPRLVKNTETEPTPVEG